MSNQIACLSGVSFFLYHWTILRSFPPYHMPVLCLRYWPKARIRSLEICRYLGIDHGMVQKINSNLNSIIKPFVL